MHILNVIHSVDPASGGPGEGLRQAVQATRRLGHRQEVLTLDGPEDAWVQSFPGPIHALGPVRSRYGYTRSLVPWLERNADDYDAVIVHGLWQFHGLAVRRALRGGRVPYFVYFHGMLDPWFKQHYPLKHLKKWLYWPWAEYRVIRDARSILFTAEEERRLASQSFWLYRARETVVGYGLALDATARSATADGFHAMFPATRGQRLVLFLGRLHVKKGCNLLIEAFSRVAGSDPRLHLVMAGPDAEGVRSGLERLAQGLGIADRITWTGMLQGPAKWAALRAADVFALPSHQENFGIAVAEALAIGVPVLISKRVNIWREITDAGAGYADEDTLDGTTKLLERWLLLSAAERVEMGKQAVACFEANFQIDEAARKLVAVLGAQAVPAV